MTIGSQGPETQPAFKRIRYLPATNLSLLLKTFWLLLCARIALLLIPVRYIIRWKQRPLRRKVEYTPREIRTIALIVAWSVERIVKRSPIRFVCFPQCLAAIWLLRRAGIDSRLHYGVTREEGRLVTHAWLEAAGEVLVGETEARKFSTLAVY